MTHSPTHSVPLRSAEKGQATTLRIVGVCAIVATLVHAASGALHGALTAGTDQSNSVTVYEHVLVTPAWVPINLTMLLALLGWLAVFVGLGQASQPGMAWRAWLGRLATVVFAVGIAAATLLFLTDAIVIPTLAEQWAAAGPARQADLVTLGDTVQTAIRVPLFHVLPLLVYGLPFALVGAAHGSRAGLLPAWLGWLAMIAGTVSLATGVSSALGSTLIPEVILWALVQPLIWVWGIATGISLWRRSARAPTP